MSSSSHGLAGAYAAGTVTLEDGTVLQFDYLLIATGSIYGNTWIKPDSVHPAQSISARVAEYEQAYQTLSSVKSVVICGGGTVGVELAGELIDAFKGDDKKQVRSLHSGGPDRMMGGVEGCADRHFYVID